MRFFDLTYREIATRAARGALAVVPLGCTEQQGPHLAVGFDAWFADELCTAAAERARERKGLEALVLPVLPFGPTPEHRGFGSGYVDLPEHVYDATLEAVLVSLADQGFRRIVVWRGCGGHRLQAVVATFNEMQKGRSVAHLPGHPFHAIWCRVADPSIAGGHADSFTTSISLFRHPELVRLSEIPEPSEPPDWDDPLLDFTKYSMSGVIGDARHASADLGERLWEACVDELADTFRDLSKLDVPRNEPTRLDY
jgi:creatinine amidohydrolase